MTRIISKIKSKVIARKYSARTVKDSDVITTNSLANTTLGWFSNRTGALVDDGARKSNNRAAHWQRKSRLVVSARFPVVNWRSRSVAKSAHAKVGFAWAVTSQSFAVRALFTQSLAVWGGKGGYFQENFGGVVRHAFWNPYPISDQNLRFFLPYFRPDKKFDTLLQTWSLNQYPISDLPYNQFPRSDQC